MFFFSIGKLVQAYFIMIIWADIGSRWINLYICISVSTDASLWHPLLEGNLVNIINNYEMTLPPQALKDKRTCRIFFSSPFGGMEDEREELTRRYFPRIQHLCSSRGIQFVAVDMRWGITSEASSSAQVINICLRELDRSDMFVGFFGQVII